MAAVPIGYSQRIHAAAPQHGSQSDSVAKPATQPTTHFPFPFPPYDIQQQLMQQVYNTLENGHVGIFESPTGTVCVSFNINNAQFTA